MIQKSKFGEDRKPHGNGKFFGCFPNRIGVKIVMVCDILTSFAIITLYRSSFACSMVRGEQQLQSYLKARKCTFILLCISYLITIVIYTIVLASKPSEESWYTLLRRWLITIFSMILSLALDLYFSSTVKWALDEQ